MMCRIIRQSAKIFMRANETPSRHLQILDDCGSSSRTSSLLVKGSRDQGIKGWWMLGKMGVAFLTHWISLQFSLRWLICSHHLPTSFWGGIWTGDVGITSMRWAIVCWCLGMVQYAFAFAYGYTCPSTPLPISTDVLAPRDLRFLDEVEWRVTSPVTLAMHV